MVTLQVWARRFTPHPHENTLRAWARDGKIIPAPIKIGRSYYVREDAKHINEVLSGPTVPHS